MRRIGVVLSTAAALSVLVAAPAASARRAPQARISSALASAPAPTGAASESIPPPTPTHAVVAASAGRPPAIPQPMYSWHGIEVPDGACGAMVGGRAQVLPCGDARVKAYRAAVARAAARRRRDVALGWAAGAVAAAALGAMAVARRRSPRRQP